MKAIFLPTIQSTGTWFCIELLKAHREVSYFSTLPDLDIEKARGQAGFTLAQVHFGEGKAAGSELRAFASLEVVEELIGKADRVLTPVRDPLLALLTAHVRDSEVRHDHITNGFLTLAEWYQRYNIFVLPVDLYSHRTPMERYQVLRRLFDFIGLPYEPYMSIWAQEWPVVNTVGDRLAREVKNYYYTQDVERILETIREDFSYLLSNESVIRPFLESLGYRDLLWWRNDE